MVKIIIVCGTVIFVIPAFFHPGFKIYFFIFYKKGAFMTGYRKRNFFGIITYKGVLLTDDVYRIFNDAKIIQAHFFCTKFCLFF